MQTQNTKLFADLTKGYTKSLVDFLYLFQEVPSGYSVYLRDIKQGLTNLLCINQDSFKLIMNDELKFSFEAIYTNSELSKTVSADTFLQEICQSLSVLMNEGYSQSQVRQTKLSHLNQETLYKPTILPEHETIIIDYC